MQRIFLISDIHGDKQAFLSLLHQVKFDESDQLFILGDVIDRGEYGIELLQYIKEQPNMTLILGNHEEMMLQSCLEFDELSFDIWIQNGGAPTYRAFNALSKVKQKELLEWLDQQLLVTKLYFDSQVYLLAHAGILPSAGTIEEQIATQTRDDLLWIRDEFLSTPASELPCIIVHGHTPTPTLHEYGLEGATSQTRGIFQSENRLALDCGKTYGFPLGMYCLNTGETYYE